MSATAALAERAAAANDAAAASASAAAAHTSHENPPPRNTAGPRAGDNNIDASPSNVSLASSVPTDCSTVASLPTGMTGAHKSLHHPHRYRPPTYPNTLYQYTTSTSTGTFLTHFSAMLSKLRPKTTTHRGSALAGFSALLLVTAANALLGPMRDAAALAVGVTHLPKLTLASTCLALVSSVPVGWLFEAPDPNLHRRRIFRRWGLTRGDTQGTSLALFYRCFAIILVLYAAGFKLRELAKTRALLASSAAANAADGGEPEEAVVQNVVFRAVLYLTSTLQAAGVGNVGYVAFFLVVHLMKLHSISLMWGVVGEAMEYEERAERELERKERLTKANLDFTHEREESMRRNNTSETALASWVSDASTSNNNTPSSSAEGAAAQGGNGATMRMTAAGPIKVLDDPRQRREKERQRRQRSRSSSPSPSSTGGGGGGGGGGTTSSSSNGGATGGGRSRARLTRLAFVGLGGTIGGIAGSLLTSLTAHSLHLSGLLLLAAVLLLLSANLSVELGNIMQRHWEEQQRRTFDDLVAMQHQQWQREHASRQQQQQQRRRREAAGATKQRQQQPLSPHNRAESIVTELPSFPHKSVSMGALDKAAAMEMCGVGVGVGGGGSGSGSGGAATAAVVGGMAAVVGPSSLSPATTPAMIDPASMERLSSCGEEESVDSSMKRVSSWGSMKRVASGNSLGSMKRVASGNSLAQAQVVQQQSGLTRAQSGPSLHSLAGGDSASQPGGGTAAAAGGSAATYFAQPEEEDSFSQRLLRGVTTILRSKLLMAIFTYNALYASTTVLLSFQRAELVANRQSSVQDQSTEADTAFLARINVVSNVAVFALQASGLGAFIAHSCGQRGTLALMPLVRLAGVLLLAWWHVAGDGRPPNLTLFLILDEFTRVINFAVAKPVREGLWRGLSNEARYEAKPIVDTLANRWGSGSAAFLVSVVDRVLTFWTRHTAAFLDDGPAAGGGRSAMVSNKTVFGFPPVLLLCLLIAAWWAMVSAHLGHIRRRIDLELKKHQ